MQPVSIAYTGDGVRRTWFIPFPYGDIARDIGVSVISAGVETSLAYGSGFTVSEHCAICAVPNGAILRIWLKSATAIALAGQEERARAAEAAGLNEARAAWHAEAASQLAVSACAEAEEKISKQVLSATSQLEALKAGVIDEARQAEAEAQARAGELGALAESARKTFTRLYEKALADLYEKAAGWLEQASLSGLNPVSDRAGLGRYSHGFCVVLPCFGHTARPLGMFPVEHKGRIRWDGFFVIIPACPGHGDNRDWQPQGPGSAGDNANGENNGSWWIPCGHEHKGLA